MKQFEAITSSELAARVEQLIHEANVRRIIIMHEGHPVVEFPVTVGVVGALVAPAVAAAGAIAALLSHCTIEIERTEEAAGPRPPPHRSRRSSSAARRRRTRP